MTFDALRTYWQTAESRLRTRLERLSDAQRRWFWPVVATVAVTLVALAGSAGDAVWIVALGTVSGVAIWRLGLAWQAVEQGRTETEQRVLADLANGIQPDTSDRALGVPSLAARQVLRDIHRRWIAPRQDQEARLAFLERLIDAAPTALVCLDAAGRVELVNQAASALFRDLTAAIRSQSPDFDVAHLAGLELLTQLGYANLLEFPAPTPSVRSSVSIGNATLAIELVRLEDDAGRLQGFLSRWDDNSARLKAEQQVQYLIGRAVSGSLDGRIEVEGLEGFMQGLGKGINMLMDAVQKPLLSIKAVQTAFAQGNLTQRMDGLFLGEFGSVQEAANQSIGQLTRIVDRVREAALAIEHAAAGLRQGNDSLAGRTGDQVDALDSAAAAIEELTSAVRNNADNANTVNELTDTVSRQAGQARDEALETRHAMEQIKRSNEAISRVVTVMDEVAFQTKLLSVNAAIEAAHAGEHGRGFGVVAGEVNALAGRSAQAAREIRELARESDRRVEQGAALVNSTSTTLTGIAEEIQRVSDLMTDIATASREQYTGTSQVEHSVQEMLQGLQQNQALVEDVASASKSLNGQAERLVSLMAFFQIDTALAAGDEPVPTSTPIDGVGTVSEEAAAMVDDFTVDDAPVAPATAEQAAPARRDEASGSAVAGAAEGGSAADDDFDFFV